MIVYSAQPNDFVPVLIRELRKIYKNNEEISIEFFKENSFSQVYSFWDDKFYTLNEMISNFKEYSGNLIDLRNYALKGSTDFISGILNVDKIFKADDDYIFTIVSNPLDRVYEMYYFLKAIINSKTALRIDKEIINYFISNYDNITLQQYIDIFIDKYGTFTTGGITVCSNMFLQFKNIDNADYIGIKEDLLGSIKKLNEKLNINIDTTLFKRFINNVRTENYREDDLKKLLHNDLNVYERIKNNYLKSK